MDPDSYSEYRSGSTKFLNTDPIWIRFHKTSLPRHDSLVTVCGQVAVRGPATEAGLNAAGLQLGPARCARGENPPLVQLYQLAPHGGGQGHAALRARPTRSLCQGQHLEIFSNRGYDIRA